MTALRDVQGIGPALESQLYEAGFGTIADLAAANPGDLVVVRGIGPVSAQQIIAAAAELNSGTSSSATAPPKSEKKAKNAKKSKKARKKNKKKNKTATGSKANKGKKKAKKKNKSKKKKA